nr:unnamed protein product [Callosobruchus analis]CAI5844472.1 unnamed protein product [Callosobruchus analis]CAI5844788.1 unnamed protein product [Callosobruchus analis]CAI5846589.1 unnamed protein product [Callosobruchus analis]CAI5854625.1 unnamed protein product [Callosobruchus analis]
MLYSHTAMRIN